MQFSKSERGFNHALNGRFHWQRSQSAKGAWKLSHPDRPVSGTLFAEGLQTVHAAHQNPQCNERPGR